MKSYADISDKVDKFFAELESAKNEYKTSSDLNELLGSITALARSTKHNYGFGDQLLLTGDEYIRHGDREAGFAIIRTVYSLCPNIVDEALLYLRMAEYHLENGDTNEGTAFLEKLCTETADNYEESIAFSELTDVWEKYRHLVYGKVPASVITGQRTCDPLPPEECRMQADEIFALPKDEILAALSEHLGEMSANGECINFLNKWERTVFYADELCMEVNSGGFYSYLYSYGNHFAKAGTALEDIGAVETLALTDAVIGKFPKKRLPKSLDSIQNALDKLDEKDIDFEAEDDAFYSSAEKELIAKLLTYVLENKKYFR